MVEQIVQQAMSDMELGLKPDGTYTPVCDRKLRLDDKVNSAPNAYTEWSLDDASKDKITQKGKGHVFVSYHWTDKATIFTIRKWLIQAGYNVKCDDDRKSNQIVERMAANVENAEVVVMCFSKKYTEDNTCTVEVKYAHQLQKKIVVLQLEADDIFDEGWFMKTGMISELHNPIPFDQPSNLDHSIAELIRALGDHGKNKTSAKLSSSAAGYLENAIEIHCDVHSTWNEPASPAGKKQGLLRGITVMYNEVFIVREDTPDVEAYDPNTFMLVRTIPVEDLSAPRDIDGSTRYSCLYIVNFVLNCVHRVELGGKVSRWPLNDNPRGISVTRDGYNLVVAFAETRKLRQYTTHGDVVREIQLDNSMMHPFHGIQLSSGQFVVCHGCRHQADAEHRLCLIDVDGHVAKSYGGAPGCDAGHVHIPERMDVDTHEFIVVHEVQNQRVLLFNSDLEFQKVLIEPRIGRKNWDIRRLSLDKPRGRLYTIEWEMHDDGEYKNSQLCIFQVKQPVGNSLQE